MKKAPAIVIGTISGTVLDSRGQPVVGAVVKILRDGVNEVVKETKSAADGKFSARVLPGRYLVLAPNSDVSGISRRLPDAERRRLRAIFKDIKPEKHGLIVRTAAEGASREALAADLDRLVGEWTQIEKRAKKAKAPAVLNEEPELTVRVVRDLFTKKVERLLIDSKPEYEVVFVPEIAGDRNRDEACSAVWTHPGPPRGKDRRHERPRQIASESTPGHKAAGGAPAPDTGGGAPTNPPGRRLDIPSRLRSPVELFRG